jgi:ribosome-binding protein aMBF1 (putative translation factor)
MKGGKKMSSHKEYLDRQLTNPEFVAEWERQRPEREYIKTIIAARLEQNLTQKELSEKTGIRQSNISRIENGNCSPTVATLQQIAAGVGKVLHIEFREVIG